MTLSILIPESVYKPKYTLDEILFPEIKPYSQGHLRVSGIHEIWYGEYGNLKGMPVIFIHGGPGAGCEDVHARFFDPTSYRIILFDQRGSKRSKPLYEIKENTTQDLISDMEELRTHLSIDKWLIFGGSWGSSLGLLYGQAFPDRCLGFVLRGMFTANDSEVENIFSMGDIFPENYNELEEFIPQNERGDMLAAYFKRLCNPNLQIALEAAKVFIKYDFEASYLMDSREKVRKIMEDEEEVLAVAKIFSHYAINKFFLKPYQIISDMNKIAHLPGIIVHGRYDIVCKISTAYKVHKNWPGSELVIIQDAGHSAFELGTAKALIEATERMCKILS